MGLLGNLFGSDTLTSIGNTLGEINPEIRQQHATAALSAQQAAQQQALENLMQQHKLAVMAEATRQATEQQRQMHELQQKQMFDALLAAKNLNPNDPVATNTVHQLVGQQQAASGMADISRYLQEASGQNIDLPSMLTNQVATGALAGTGQNLNSAAAANALLPKAGETAVAQQNAARSGAQVQNLQNTSLSTPVNYNDIIGGMQSLYGGPQQPSESPMPVIPVTPVPSHSPLLDYIRSKQPQNLGAQNPTPNIPGATAPANPSFPTMAPAALNVVLGSAHPYTQALAEQARLRNELEARKAVANIMAGGRVTAAETGAKAREAVANISAKTKEDVANINAKIREDVANINARARNGGAMSPETQAAILKALSESPANKP
jgi:hypothetical protein